MALPGSCSALSAVFALAVLAAPVATLAQSAALTGRVLDTTGGLVAGVLVRVVSIDGRTRDITTTADGTFAFADLPRGVVEVSASSAGFAMTQHTLRLDGRPTTIELVLRPGALAEEVTVFGTRLAASDQIRRRLPGAVDVLSGEVLEASRVFTTSEALRKVPGVHVRDEEGLGLRPNIAVRGLNPTRSTKVLLLEDGVPTAYAPYGDNASYYHPPIERFERVEVQKGSSQIAHGPVTVGAVINYITPEPARRPTASLGVSAGSRDFLNLSLGGTGTWRATGAVVHLMRKQSDGARDNVFSTLDDVNLKVTQQVTPLHSLSAKVNYYTEDSQVTYSGLRASEFQQDPRQNPFVNDRFDGKRLSGVLAHRGLVGGRVAWTTTFYTASFDRDWWRQSSNSGQRPNDSADPICAGMANLLTTCGNEGRLRSYMSWGLDSRARLHVELGAVRHDTDAGVRVHAENQDRLQVNGDTPVSRTGRAVEDNLRTTDAWSAFVQHAVQWGSVAVTPGLRVERVEYGRTNRLLGVSGATTITEWLPGLGVAVSAGSDATIFAGVHRGFAPPRAEDIISNTTGGVVDLDPERGWNYEAGARGRLAAAVSGDVTFFRLDYENQIVPASVAGGVGATLTNGGKTRHQGVEASLSADTATALGDTHALSTRAAITWLPTASFAGPRFSTVGGSTTTSVSGNRLPYTPRSTASITVGYRHRLGLDAQLEVQQVGEQFGDDLNSQAETADGQRGIIPGVTVWNAAVNWRLPAGGTVFVAVKNLADRLFIVDRVRGILPGIPRLVQAGVIWRF